MKASRPERCLRMTRWLDRIDEVRLALDTYADRQDGACAVRSAKVMPPICRCLHPARWMLRPPPAGSQEASRPPCWPGWRHGRWRDCPRAKPPAMSRCSRHAEPTAPGEGRRIENDWCRCVRKIRHFSKKGAPFLPVVAVLPTVYFQYTHSALNQQTILIYTP